MKDGMVDEYYQNTLEKHLKFSKNKLSFKRNNNFTRASNRGRKYSRIYLITEVLYLKNSQPQDIAEFIGDINRTMEWHWQLMTKEDTVTMTVEFSAIYRFNIVNIRIPMKCF